VPQLHNKIYTSLAQKDTFGVRKIYILSFSFLSLTFVFLFLPYNNTRYEKVLTPTNILLLISEKDIVASLESVS